MAKKRKAGQPFGAATGHELGAIPPQTRFNLNERFDDSEDEFLAGADRVLLNEGPDAKRRREALEPSDEEILGYDSEAPSDAGDTDDLDDEADASGADGQAPETLFDVSSGEEDEPVDNLRDWGTTRDSYYNADAIETEADALEEEAEAKRIQQKRLQDVTERDFEFDGNDWTETYPDMNAEVRGKGIVREKLPDLVVTDGMNDQEKLKILKGRYPEFEPLTKDFVDLQTMLGELVEAVKAARTTMQSSVSPGQGDEFEERRAFSVAVTKWRALSAYLASIAVYLTILTSAASKGHSATGLAMAPRELHNHSIIDYVFKSRKLWEKVKDIPTPIVESPRKEEVLNADGNLTGEAPLAHEDGQPQSKKRKMTKSQKAAAAAKVAAEKAQAERMAKAEADLAELSSLLKPRERAAPLPEKALGQESDFGDEAPLTASEAAEKARRKKSLRFYTSQIAQKANKRGSKSRDAGGDTDLPYKERIIDRRERLNREAEKRGREGDVATGLDTQPDEDNEDDQDRIASELRNAAHEDDQDVFDFMTANKARKEAQKASRSAAYAEAEREALKFGARVHKAEKVDEDGRRGISYQIQKNKGLTPKRTKEVRNPRVKKRKQFSSSLRKLGSIRPIYKGGEGRGGYGGELTGINRNVVKSVKL
ncbi:MAG: hypothetical protein Q9227_005937 [Pyrenula ochraceoflavens]